MPVLLAFAFSLALHGIVLFIPGWSLPAPETPVLTAVLVTPAPPVAAAPSLPPTPPRPRRAPPPPPPAPPVVSAATNPAAVVEAPPALPPSETETTQPEEGEAASGAVAAGAEPPLPDAPWPTRAELAFAVSRNDLLIGESRHLWERQEGRYTLTVSTRTTGLAALFRPLVVEQRSDGELNREGLQPHDYRQWRDGRLRESLTFAPADGTIILADGRATAFLPSQDMISWLYQLGWLRQDAELALLYVATARKLSQYAIEIGSEEDVDTELGRRTARRYRVGGAPETEFTEVWIDSTIHLPIRIRHRDRKGDLYEQRLISLDVAEPSAH